MIMQHLLDENTYKTLDPCIDNKIHHNLFEVPRTVNICFTEHVWKFLYDKHHEVINLYRLPKIQKSKIIESVINTQKIEIIEIF